MGLYHRAPFCGVRFMTVESFVIRLRAKLVAFAEVSGNWRLELSVGVLFWKVVGGASVKYPIIIFELPALIAGNEVPTWTSVFVLHLIVACPLAGSLGDSVVSIDEWLHAYFSYGGCISGMGIWIRPLCWSFMVVLSALWVSWISVWQLSMNIDLILNGWGRRIWLLLKKFMGANLETILLYAWVFSICSRRWNTELTNGCVRCIGSWLCYMSSLFGSRLRWGSSDLYIFIGDEYFALKERFLGLLVWFARVCPWNVGRPWGVHRLLSSYDSHFARVLYGILRYDWNWIFEVCWRSLIVDA